MTDALGRGGNSAVDGKTGSKGVTISFAARYEASDQFDAIFKEGMALVDSTASYLDGTGRRDARALPAQTSLRYASESMRLTTRLLELASWLLVRQALKDGDISVDEARAKRQRMKLDSIGRPSHVKNFDDLPEKLRKLITQSHSLQDRIIKIDRAIEGDAGQESDAVTAAVNSNPVADHMARIEAAFSS